MLNDLKKKMVTIKGLKLITADANAMYTNINTKHAIEVLKKWFKLHEKELPADFPLKLVLAGIEHLMTHNVFSFGTRSLPATPW